MANNYTTEYIRGESGTYIIGITNNEHRTMDYTMEVRLENKSLPLPENLQHIRLPHNTTLEEPLEITPSVEGENMKLEFQLYNDQVFAMRAIAIAVAGKHHMLMIGNPGAGKTMLARIAADLQPRPAEEHRASNTRPTHHRQSVPARSGHRACRH